MRPTDLLHSAFLRFALVLTGVFTLGYLVAGWVAFQAIGADLDARVRQAAEYTASTLQDVAEASGPGALVEAVATRARVADPDDDVLWIGTRDGQRLAGQALPDPGQLTEGDVPGARIGADPDDRYRLTVRDIGDLRLVTGHSYEDSDEIGTRVLAAFAGAALLSMLLAAIAAVTLSRSGQQRIERISGTLHAVSRGQLDRRIPTAGREDDLGQLAGRINEALDRLQAMVEGIREVGADIAHDLRTPINRLGIRIEQLRADTRDQPELEERLELVARETREISRTFDALLRIAQIEASATRARMTDLALADIAATLHEAYAPVAEEQGQNLQLAPAPPADRVHGDRDSLMQLFSNLIENALRHAGDQARIRIATGQDDTGPWMSVTDDGPGIPPAEHDKVLRRFYRLDKSRATPGSGLGLALVKAIADMHGARLEIEDLDPGLRVQVRFAASRGTPKDTRKPSA